MKIDDASFSIFCKLKDKSSLSDDEPEDLSDIVDSEVNFYLNDKRETHYRKIIWEKINKEYLQEQAAKNQIRAVDTAGVQKSKKRQRAKEAAKSKPDGANLEATGEIQTKKRLSSKINFDVLGELFSDNPASDSNENMQVSSCQENSSNRQRQCVNQLGEDMADEYSDVVLEEDDDRKNENLTENCDDEYVGFEDEEEYGYNYDDYGYGDDDGY